ncbi:GATOR complex protein MIOS isoform X2 [Nematostella vectensis]|uniref:GATOR complex protein MIOS isoform X2 n=1 Tax=Nematostella vectensis TaxID=45351 RepID=UPI002077546F|nr:GATOR complex protein MIOS isoform X2 [Nematostella vectensis]
MKWEVQWSPNHSDKFIAFNHEICLYKTVTAKDATKSSGCRNQAIKLSDESYAVPLSVIGDVQSLKCIAWYPHSNPDDLLAIGQGNGRVVITSFGCENRQADNSLRREFVPRHSRQCNALAWNPVSRNLLAAGLDKVRNDVSLLVWDINIQLTVRDIAGQDKPSRYSSSSGKQSPNMGTGMNDPGIMGNRPLAELSTSEQTHSVAWFPRDHNCLVAGQAQKFLRIFDLRDPTRPHSAAITKAVSGVNVDPHLEHQVASFSEGPPGVICLWDIRNFETPIMTVSQPSALASISWSPSRFGLLSTLNKDSSVVRLYDIQHAHFGAMFDGYDTDTAIIERTAQPSKSLISSFSWHPTYENQMLTVSPTGTISEYTIFERISVGWSPNYHLTIGCGRHLVECSKEASEASLEDDISTKMKRRALAGYGITAQDLKSISKITQDMKLLKLWTWLNQVKKIRDKVKKKGFKFYGIKSAISGDLTTADMTSTKTKSDSSYQEQRLVTTLYYSEERKTALSLCGWDFADSSGSLPEFLNKLQEQGKYERAAAIALFNSKIRQAIEILRQGAKVNQESSDKDKGKTLNMVAMALSGYTEEKRTLWREMCSNLCHEIEHPYLRAAFAFLTCEDDNFDSILSDRDIEVEDIVAFACKFLPDSKLVAFIKMLTSLMVEAGDLDGMLLTGVTPDGVDLLEKYVNRTTDVQTACLVIINSVQNISDEVKRDKRVSCWIESYRNLLDTWRMWHQRAQLDIHYTLKDSSQKPPQQVFVSCNFCGNSILTTPLPTESRPRRIAQYYTPANRPKIMGCPGCRKPLPRCALCMVHMGTPSQQNAKPPQLDVNAEKPAVVRSVNPFTSWFTWCQSCRHGGHADHISDWFREHLECPVSGCECHCMNLDSVAMAMSSEVTDVAKKTGSTIFQ